MSWILVRAEFASLPPDLSPFVEIFREFGVENTLEDSEGLQGCVVEVEGSTSVVDSLRAALLDHGVEKVTVEPYVEQDWEIAWKQFFKARRVGERILVVPTWEEAEPRPGDLVLRLDPGQAFGTGDHPTTRLCLELLERLELADQRVADVGCGSGILAIVAVKLGAWVVAVDIDPVALEVAKENAERNGVELETYCGDGLQELLESPSYEQLSRVPQDERPLGAKTNSSQLLAKSSRAERRFDVVVSNIISATLIRLAPQLTSVIRPGGHWIVSGIIEENWADVSRAAVELGLRLITDLHEDGWVAATFRMP